MKQNKAKTPKNLNNLVSDIQDSADKMSPEFADILAKISSTDFNCEKVAYIDPEVHDILAMIKAKTGVPIGTMLSFLVKEFINENKEHIKELLISKNELLK